MQFSLHIFDSESWDDYLDTDVITLRSSLDGTFEQAYDDRGDVAYEGNGVKIVAKGLSYDSSWLGPGVRVEIINTGVRDVTVQARFSSVNGFMIEPFFSCDVCAGKCAIDDMTFADSSLEDNGIEDIELSFHVFDAESWDTIVDTDTVTIRF